MSDLYERTFKVGFAISVGTFLLGNVISYVSALQQYYALKAGSQFNQIVSYLSMPNWGFPFPYWGYSSLMFEDGSVGLAFNFTSAVVASFVVGFLFKRFLKSRWATNNE
jgi:hypothetical protein